MIRSALLLAVFLCSLPVGAEPVGGPQCLSTGESRSCLFESPTRLPNPAEESPLLNHLALAQLDSPSPSLSNANQNASHHYGQVERAAINQAHADCFAQNCFPSASACRNCHPEQYREWSVSSHAYAQLSPVFNAMSNKLIKDNNGTLGDFCIRCHTPVGMAINEPITMANADRHPTSREGVTCVVCHRINQAWGKGSGRLALVEGDIHTPVSGPVGSQRLAMVLNHPEKYGVLKTHPDPEVKGRSVHGGVVPFFQLTTPGFCGTCHDVFAPNGFRLEDAFSEFKASPAAREKHQSCQDCHMGVVPGVAGGYACGPAAIVGNAPTPVRKRANHMMVGPDYSIVHPGIFPHNPAAVREEHAHFQSPVPRGLATIREWLLFDHEAGWGLESFEKDVPQDQHFPAPWDDQTRRYRARDILDAQFRLLGEAAMRRHQLLATGFRLGNIHLEACDKRGLRFSVLVSNGTDGHGVPTGFDAERIVFVRAMVFDAAGKLLFISGDLDANGDLRDSHSSYVHNGLVPPDRQLFSLQTKFVIRNVRGGEREQVLAVPYSLDPLPYVRPETRPFTVLGRPVGTRRHKQLLMPGGSRWARYKVPTNQLCGPGPYTMVVQLIAGMVPVNLVRDISSAGFDYGLSAREVAARVVAGHEVLHERRLTLQPNQLRK
jgi:hypothetical protein